MERETRFKHDFPIAATVIVFVVAVLARVQTWQSTYDTVPGNPDTTLAVTSPGDVMEHVAAVDRPAPVSTGWAVVPSMLVAGIDQAPQRMGFAGLSGTALRLLDHWLVELQSLVWPSVATVDRSESAPDADGAGDQSPMADAVDPSSICAVPAAPEYCSDEEIFEFVKWVTPGSVTIIECQLRETGDRVGPNSRG